MSEGARSGKRLPLLISAALVTALAAPVVMDSEGLVLYTYDDPAWGARLPTACYGETGPHIRHGQTYTVEQCTRLLDASLQRTWIRLRLCIVQPIAPNEAAALISWAYNVGTDAACKSTLVRKLNAGEPFCQELDRWVYANGKKRKGLVTRRAKERALCDGSSLD